MKCHYKVLEIESDADESKIKTAYRRLALKWHPDKNLDNAEYAKQQFQFVQQAYDVLSDRQERAWYDKHRDQILYGKDYKDEALDVFPYFTTSCFKGYNDGPEGFYTVYRNVFEKIAAEDAEHAEDDADSAIPPSFGGSLSDYNDVVGPFYAFWTSYNTTRGYGWLNPHDIQQIRDRRVFKLMDKENKKVRQQAKKERNEEIRALVAFVKKRDVRVQENSKRLEAKIVQNRLKQEEMSRKKRIERQKELDDAKPIAEWAKFDNVEKELKGIEKDLAQTFGEDISDNELLGHDNLFCIACNKLFKTTKGFENHEISKKHKQNVKMLKKTMTAEDTIDDDSKKSDRDNEDLENDIEISSDTKIIDKKKTKKPKNVLQTVCETDSDIDNSFIVNTDLEEQDHFPETSTKKQKRKTKSASPQTDVSHQNCVASERNLKKEKLSHIKNDLICATCKSQFPSKNKLFNHLKTTNHGILLTTAGSHKNKKI